MLTHWHNSPRAGCDAAPFWVYYPSNLTNQCCLISTESANTDLIVLGLTQSGIDPTVNVPRPDTRPAR